MGVELSIVDFSLVSALGTGRAETLANMKAGTAPGMRALPGLVGGESTYFGFVPGWNAKRPETIAPGLPRVGAIVDLAYRELAGSVERMKAAVGAKRIGVVMGSSNSTMEEFTDNPDRINMDYPAERVAEIAGITGPVLTVSTACSSSGKVFAAARRLLDGGAADAVVVGGADAYTRTVVEGFHSLEALSSTLCRPCSASRDGITLGEGAALFLLCRPGLLPSSGSRYPIPDFRLLGVGESSDAYHLTAPDPEGRGAERAMRAALADAGTGPEAVSFVNLHGTGTVYNDAMELAAVDRVFNRRVCAISTKPFTGHCLGAAGAIEAALCGLALAPDSRMPESVRRFALSNSFAFGGSNASVLLARG